VAKNHTISGVIAVGGAQQPQTPPNTTPPPPNAAGGPVRFVFKSEQYYDQRGGRVEHRVLISGAFPPNCPPFWGHVTVRVETPEGLLNEQMQFPIEGATTLEEAFARFEPALQAAAERRRQELMKRYHGPQLAVPGVNMPAGMRLPPAPQKKSGLIIPP